MHNDRPVADNERSHEQRGTEGRVGEDGLKGWKHGKEGGEGNVVVELMDGQQENNLMRSWGLDDQFSSLITDSRESVALKNASVG